MEILAHLIHLSPQNNKKNLYLYPRQALAENVYYFSARNRVEAERVRRVYNFRNINQVAESTYIDTGKKVLLYSELNENIVYW